MLWRKGGETDTLWTCLPLPARTWAPDNKTLGLQVHAPGAFPSTHGEASSISPLHGLSPALRPGPRWPHAQVGSVLRSRSALLLAPRAGTRSLPCPSARLSCSLSWVSFSRALRCRMQTSFCCSGVRYCSGVGGLIPWLSLHSVYLTGRLQRQGGQQAQRAEQLMLLLPETCLVLSPLRGQTRPGSSDHHAETVSDRLQPRGHQVQTGISPSRLQSVRAQTRG